MSAVLTCSGLDAGYVPGRPVLRNIDISLDEGTVLALLGPNGAGKTTLLLTIAGLQPPLAGHIGLGGSPVRPGSPRAAVKAGLVLVPDDRSLFKGLTVAENLKLASRHGNSKRRGTTVEMIFDYFPDLKRRVKVAAGNLSGGEQQMLAIGRALMSKPRLLLMDEPSAGLAPLVVEQVFDLVRRIREEGSTVLIVEQNVSQVLAVVDRAYLLEVGRIRLAGSAAELRDNALIRQSYMGL